MSLVAYDPDGTAITVTGATTDVTLFRWKDIRRPSVLPSKIGPVSTVALSHDATTLATVNADGRIRLWDVAFPKG